MTNLELFFYLLCLIIFIYLQTILATIYGRENSILCQASGSVNVVVPSSAVLNVQSEKLGVNREMPIYPAFLRQGSSFSNKSINSPRSPIY